MAHRRQRALIYSLGIRIDRNCIDRSQHCWDSVNTQAETFDRVSPNNMGIGTLGRGQPDNSHRALQKFALYLVYRQVWTAPESIPRFCDPNTICGLSPSPLDFQLLLLISIETTSVFLAII